MNEHLKRLADEHMAQLNEAKKKADEAFARAKRDLGSLAEFAEQLPQRILDRCSEIFVGEIEYPEGCYFRPDECRVNVGGQEEYFIRGDRPRRLSPMKGKFRVILVLQKIE